MSRTINDYYELDAVSQSKLKALHSGIGFYKKEQKYYFKEEPHWVIGDGVDVLLSRPDEFENEFYESDYDSKPAKGALSIGKYVWDALNEPVKIITKVRGYFSVVSETGKFYHPNDFDHSEDIQFVIDLLEEAIENDEYGGGWDMERKIKTVIKKILPYWNDLINANGRQILSEKEKDVIERVAEVFKTHDHIKPFFDNDLPKSFQYPVHWEKQEVPCKGLIDMLITNDTGQVVVLDNGFTIKPNERIIVDFKTLSSPAYKCYQSIKRWRYDIQLAWYKEGLNEYGNEYANSDIRCVLLFVSTLEDDTPVVWELTKSDLAIAQHGAYMVGPDEFIPSTDVDVLEFNRNNLDIWGYEAMFELYCDHESNNVWDMPYELYLCKGIVNKSIWR